jgi:hypothetical protein
MLRWIALVILAFGTWYATAAPTLELKGIALSSSKAQLDAQFPNLACAARSSPEIESICTFGWRDQRDIPELNTLAGSPVKEWKFTFHDDRLGSIVAVMEAKDFSKVQSALVEKYGKSKNVQAAGMHLSSWTLAGGSLSAAVLPSSNFSSVSMTASWYEAIIKKKAEEEAARRKKDL